VALETLLTTLLQDGLEPSFLRSWRIPLSDGL
jgi:hypothetical protein